MNDARPALVIGYGNTLRGDDAVGPRAAAVVQSWGLRDVTVLAVTQLTPELAASLAAARLAIFVDARFAVEDAPVEVEILTLQPSSGSSVFGHSGEPRHLLAMAQAVYGTCPQAWLVTVPAADFRLGNELSPQANSGLDAALGKIAKLLMESQWPFHETASRIHANKSHRSEHPESVP